MIARTHARLGIAAAVIATLTGPAVGHSVFCVGCISDEDTSGYAVKLRWSDNLAFAMEMCQSGPVGGSGSFDCCGCTHSMSGSATPGRLQGAYGKTANGCCAATPSTCFNLVGFVITQTSGPPATTVPVSLNLSIESTAFLGGFSDGLTVAGKIRAQDTGPEVTFHNDYDGDVSTIYTTPSVDLPVGEPFRVEVETGLAWITGNESQSGSWTVSFPTAGPVFNLPAGFTVSGADGRVADNGWFEPRPGDINNDLVVDISDLLALLGAWGPCPAPCPPTCAADTNWDCTVNVTDLLQLLADWG